MPPAALAVTAEAPPPVRGFLVHPTPRPPAPGARDHARLFESVLQGALLGLVHVVRASLQKIFRNKPFDFPGSFPERLALGWRPQTN